MFKQSLLSLRLAVDSKSVKVFVILTRSVRMAVKISSSSLTFGKSMVLRIENFIFSVQRMLNYLNSSVRRCFLLQFVPSVPPVLERVFHHPVELPLRKDPLPGIQVLEPALLLFENSLVKQFLCCAVFCFSIHIRLSKPLFLVPV